MRRIDGRFMASEPHLLDEGPFPDSGFHLDLTPWLESPSVHELIGRIREVREVREDAQSEADAPGTP